MTKINHFRLSRSGLSNHLNCLLAVLILAMSSASSAWHQEASLQSVSTTRWVSLPGGGPPPIQVSLPAQSRVGSERFTLLDLNLGQIWNENEIAIRRADGEFLAATRNDGSAAMPPDRLGFQPLQTVTGPAGNQVIAPRFRFRLFVMETGSHCPDAFTLEEPAAGTSPPLQRTALVTDGCLIAILTADRTARISVSASQELELLPEPATIGAPASLDASHFRLRLHGLPRTLMLSAPFLQHNRLLPWVVHLDRRAGTAGTLGGCEDRLGRGPTMPGGRPCYRRHEGTDFLIRPISVGLDTSSPPPPLPPLTFPLTEPQGVRWGWADVNVLAAAPGEVVDIRDGNLDVCYFNPIANCSQINFANNNPSCPNPVDSRYQDMIKCGRLPAGRSDPSPSPTTNPSINTRANVVRVVQDDGLIVSYVHLRNGSITVRLGDRVECGQVLGVIGSSGTSSIPHLHFDLLKPPGLNTHRPASENAGLPQAAPGWFTDRPDQGSDSFVVDPYDNSDANGRSTMWAALHDDMGPSKLPKLTCHHPSQATASNIRGGTPNGAPCSATNQCRLGSVCSSANICESPRPPGTSCLAERDCERFSACESGLCTRNGLPLGQACGPGRICANGLSCQRGFCAVNIQPPPPPAPECPSGTSLKCPAGCRFTGSECRKQVGPRDILCPPRACTP